jgi:hypothetical protein
MADIVPIKAHRAYERKTKQSAAGVLKDCRSMHPTEVLVIGYAADGELFVRGSPPDPGNAFWLMEMARKKLVGGNG